MAHRILWRQNIGRGFPWRDARSRSWDISPSPERLDSQVQDTEYNLMEQVVSSPVRAKARAAIALTAAFYAFIVGGLSHFST